MPRNSNNNINTNINNNRRFRSQSSGSYTESMVLMSNKKRTTSFDASHQQISFNSTSTAGGSSNNNNNNMNEVGAFHQLMQMILNWRDDSGCSLLHQNDDILLTHRWLQLLQKYDDTKQKQHLQAHVSQRDLESGYTPLHRAILDANLEMVLLFLLNQQPSVDRFLQKPIELLLQAHNNASPNQLDCEQLTPFQLLGKLQIKSLERTRRALPVPNINVDATHRANSFSKSSSNSSNSGNNPRRKTSFSIEDEDDFTLLSEGMRILQQLERQQQLEEMESQNTNNSHNISFEVLTFGSANHCALGVASSSTKETKQVRPQRVVLSTKHGHHQNHQPVQVVAAHHHTLIRTRQGALFACGLGHTGRLGNGSQQNLVTPGRVLGSLTNKRVTFVAAAEHHSLCCCSNGAVYAWGSNRFGQLDGGAGDTSKLLPFRVCGMDGKATVAVAAGERHSVALTNDGSVYTWGDNASGQLGRRTKTPVDRAVLQNDKMVLQIAASHCSTLALVSRSRNQLQNTVYSWGHGNPVPLKVNFESLPGRQPVNPTAVASAKHHNVALSSTGQVFSWGPKGASQSFVQATIVQEAPKGAVAVSASDQHTSIITQEGYLYTWGATNTSTNIMGHEGRKWQPSPRRVPGVCRAVSVSIAKEHTVLLMAQERPPLPTRTKTLEDLAGQTVAKNVDLFNIIPIAITAERLQSEMLQRFCRDFIRLNLEAVLTLGRKSEFDVYLREQILDRTLCLDRDATIHPLVVDILVAGQEANNAEEFHQACQTLVDSLPISALVKYKQNKRRASSFHHTMTDELEEEQDGALQTGFQGCSERCLVLTANLDHLNSEESIQSKYDCLVKEIRGIRKRLTQISKLESNTGKQLSSEEQMKMARKPLLEADLSQLRPTLEKVEKMMIERNMAIKARHGSIAEEKPRSEEDKEGVPQLVEEVQEEEAVVTCQPYRCDICGVNCPDSNSFELHKNGRKHRNRVAQVEEEEKQAAAQKMMEQKRKQMIQSPLSSDKGPVSSANTAPKANPWGERKSPQPRYKLPPPPHAPVPTWLSSPTTRENQPTNLRSIFAEEEAANSKKKQVSPAVVTPKKAKCVVSPGIPKAKPTSSQPLLLNPGNITPMKSPPWAAAPRVIVPTPVKAPTPVKPSPVVKGEKQSLQDFLNGPSPAKASPGAAKTSTAPWATPKTSTTSKSVATSDVSSKASPSLLEIQREEHEYNNRQAQHSAREGKWFIERMERADSLSAIQEAEEEERAHRIVVEEQRRIEEEIARVKQEQQQKKRRNHNRTKQQQQQRKKGSGKAQQQQQQKSKQKKQHPKSKAQKQKKKEAPDNGATAATPKSLPDNTPTAPAVTPS